MLDQDPPGVIVRLPDGELAELEAHADVLGVPVRTLLRRSALAAVRVTRAGLTPRQVIEGAAAALHRDHPTWSSAVCDRAAGSVMRWLLARCAVLPLPAPLTGRGVWAVQLGDGTVLEVRAGLDPDGARPGVRVGGQLALTPEEFRAVAAAGLAACQHPSKEVRTARRSHTPQDN